MPIDNTFSDVKSQLTLKPLQQLHQCITTVRVRILV